MGIIRFKYMHIITIFMEITKLILVVAYAIFAAYVMYRLFFRKDPLQIEYERLYKEIVHSDKYKVKGQHDR